MRREAEIIHLHEAHNAKLRTEAPQRHEAQLPDDSELLSVIVRAEFFKKWNLSLRYKGFSAEEQARLNQISNRVQADGSALTADAITEDDYQLVERFIQDKRERFMSMWRKRNVRARLSDLIATSQNGGQLAEVVKLRDEDSDLI